MNSLCVIGIGRLGLAFSLTLANKGYNVYGVDINDKYVKELDNKSFISDEPEINYLLKNTYSFYPTTNLKNSINNSDYIYILVDTPSTADDYYDCTNLRNVLLALNNLDIDNKHIIIGCTVMPGYINNVASSLITKNATISYNPEFIQQGNIVHNLKNPDMILIGTKSFDVEIKLKEIYDIMTDNDPKYNYMDPISAEITKIALNCFITTKITFANMVGDLASVLKADEEKILTAIGSDSRVGDKSLKYGLSYGGPCFVRDNRAYGQLLKNNDINPTIPIATDLYNDLHSEFLTKELLKENKEIYIVENIRYKPNTTVNIIEHSPQLKIAEKLLNNNKKVIIRDNENIINMVKKIYGNKFQYENKI